MPPTSESVFSRSALERVLKASSKVKRVEVAALDSLVSVLDALVVNVAVEAGDLVRAKGHKIVMEEDVKLALEHQLGRPGTGDPRALFAALESASTDELGRLVKLIDEWVAQRKAQRP